MHAEAHRSPDTLPDVHDSPNGERVGESDPTSGASWSHLDQQKLTSRWPMLNAEDFGGLDGRRDRFVQRLASRRRIAPDEADRELADFEARKAIRWTHGSGGPQAAAITAAPAAPNAAGTSAAPGAPNTAANTATTGAP